MYRSATPVTPKGYMLCGNGKSQLLARDVDAVGPLEIGQQDLPVDPLAPQVKYHPGIIFLTMSHFIFFFLSLSYSPIGPSKPSVHLIHRFSLST